MLIARILTAVVLLAVLIPVVFVGPVWAWGIVSLALLMVACVEWIALLPPDRLGARDRIAVLVAGLAVVSVVPTGQFAQPLLISVCFPALLFWVLVAPRRLARHDARSGGRPLALGVLAACWVALLSLRAAGPEVLLSAMAIVWVADIAAYFAGRAFGRHKLAPTISPGKSWEGAIAGVLAVALIGLASAQLDALANALPARLVLQWGVPAALVVLGLLAALSVIGDLFESLLKRQAGVKDSGKSLPGHGGVLDRIDALVPTMPVVALLHELLR